MTAAEITAKIAQIDQAITDVLSAGEEYETESSSSRRKTKMTSLADLEKQRGYYEQKLAEVSGNSGLVISF